MSTIGKWRCELKTTGFESDSQQVRSCTTLLRKGKANLRKKLLLKMVSSEKFCIQWNDFESHISTAFRDLRGDERFFDVTLAFDDGQLQAHKVILSACSSFFSRVLHRIIHEHPLLYLKGVKKAQLVSVLDFMYLGEVNVAQDELTSFLSVAGELQVKGLTEANNSSACKPDNHSISSRAANECLRLAVPPSLSKPVQKSTPPVPVPTYSQQEQDTGLNHLLNIKEEEPASLMPLESQNHSGIATDPNGFEFDEGSRDVGRDYDTRMVEVNMSAAEGNEEMEALVQSYLERSVDELTGRLQWLCRQCGKSHQNFGNLRDHIEAKHIEGPRLVCQLCLKSFKSSASLRMHKRRFHRGEY